MKHWRQFRRITLDADITPFGSSLEQREWIAMHAGHRIYRAGSGVLSAPPTPQYGSVYYIATNKSGEFEAVSYSLGSVVRWAEIQERRQHRKST